MSQTPDPRLSEDAQRALAELERHLAEIKKQPGFESEPITNPDKYAGPIGADGNIVTYPSVEALPPKAPLRIREDDETPDQD